MKELVLSLLLYSVGCHGAGIGVGMKVGSASAAAGAVGAGGYHASGVFFGPFWAASIKKYVGGVGGFPVPAGAGGCGVCNGNDQGNMGICAPAGSCVNDGDTSTGGGEIVGDCSEYGPGAVGQMECCKNIVKCGETVKNGSYISYFQNPSYPEPEKKSMSCNIKIEVMPKVVQLRFDFLEFELPAPDKKYGKCSSKNSMVIMAPQRPLGVLGKMKSNGGLCGLNTGQHLYVPVVEGEQVQVITTLTGYGSVPLNRASLAYDQASAYKWNVMVTQIEGGADAICMADMKAPDGCAQYFSESHGKITSFNFDGYSAIAPNLDYSICFNPEVDMAKGITIRSTVFKMPTGGADAKFCADGKEIVNKKTFVECCLNPSSSYLGFTAWQPYSMQKYDEKAIRRYWCGENLGTEGQISGDDFTMKVFTGNDYKCKYDPIGFEMEFKVDTGI